jgi:hypothetical protein
MDSRFLPELPTCRSQRVFPREEYPLGNRPRSLVAVGPEGPTRMSQENLQWAPRAAEEQESGANLDSLGHSLLRVAVTVINPQNQPTL